MFKPRGFEIPRTSWFPSTKVVAIFFALSSSIFAGSENDHSKYCCCRQSIPERHFRHCNRFTCPFPVVYRSNHQVHLDIAFPFVYKSILLAVWWVCFAASECYMSDHLSCYFGDNPPTQKHFGFELCTLHCALSSQCRQWITRIMYWELPQRDSQQAVDLTLKRIFLCDYGDGELSSIAIDVCLLDIDAWFGVGVKNLFSHTCFDSSR